MSKTKNLSRKKFLQLSALGTAAMPAAALASSAESPSDRYQRGWKKLREIDGTAGENVINTLRDIAPDLGRYIIEFPFGEFIPEEFSR